MWHITSQATLVDSASGILSQETEGMSIRSVLLREKICIVPAGQAMFYALKTLTKIMVMFGGTSDQQMNVLHWGILGHLFFMVITIVDVVFSAGK